MWPDIRPWGPAGPGETCAGAGGLQAPLGGGGMPGGQEQRNRGHLIDLCWKKKGMVIQTRPN